MDSKYAFYAGETALCVDLAYAAMEQDILAEIGQAAGREREGFDRLLKRLRARRKALDGFSQVVGASS